MKTLIRRMIGAARLNAATYEQVEADPASIAGAIFVVLSASVAAAFGTGLREWAEILYMTVISVITWMIWVGLTYIIGTHLLPEPTTHSSIIELLRTTGFSAAPGVLRVLGLLPLIGVPIMMGITLWMLLTFVVAVRQALDYTHSSRALAVCVLGWLIYGVVLFGMVRTAI